MVLRQLISILEKIRLDPDITSVKDILDEYLHDLRVEKGS